MTKNVKLHWFWRLLIIDHFLPYYQITNIPEWKVIQNKMYKFQSYSFTVSILEVPEWSLFKMWENKKNELKKFVM